MIKKVEVWEAKDNSWFETEEECREYEAKEELESLFPMGDGGYALIHKIRDDPEFAKAVMAYLSARQTLLDMENKRNDRPEEIKKVLG